MDKDQCCAMGAGAPISKKDELPERRRRRTYDIKRPHSCEDNRILLQCERNSMCFENRCDGPEGEFVNILTKHIIKTLDIPWNEHRLFESILKAALGDHIKDLLEDYLDYWVEEYGIKIKIAFDLDENIKPDYTYAQHARLSPIIEAAVKKYRADKCTCNEGRKEDVKKDEKK